jgi:hypothetical protein
LLVIILIGALLVLFFFFLMRTVFGERFEQTCERANERGDEGGMRAPREKKFFVALQQRCEKQQASKRESSIRLFFFRFGGGFGNESL